MAKILHIGACGSIMNPFVEFVKNNFDFNQHEFLMSTNKPVPELATNKNVHIAERTVSARLMRLIVSVIKMHQAKKVILHGLFDIKLVYLLFFMPWLLKKCYWVMWGGDLYVYQLGERNWKWKLREFFRRSIIKNMGHLVTYIKGDYELAQQWYGARGQYHECFMYPSNLYKDYQVPEKQHTGINILVGNSADPSNNHLDVLEKLETYKQEDIKIYAPLSYGNPDHAKRVIQEGKKRFGDKFIPLTEMMPFQEYIEFLGLIDIAIFNHKRQQAMGNTITLLGLGKKVYIRADVTQWDFFKDQGVVVYDIETFALTDNKNNKYEENKGIVKSNFSEFNLVRQQQLIFV
jgi:dTDP-N-acetylfucosamine:lipid II N-acetylfucosaminyltransferase